MRHLLHDFVPDVPRQDEDEVWLRFIDLLWWKDRNVSARRDLAVLVRIAVDRVIEEVGSNAAVVEQRISLAGSTIAGDRLSFTFRVDEKFEEAAFCVFHLLTEAPVVLNAIESELTFAREQRLHA